MNYYQIALILVTAVYVISFFIVRKIIRRITDLGIKWREEAFQLSEQNKTINNQYRQVAKILEALRTIKK